MKKHVFWLLLVVLILACTGCAEQTVPSSAAVSVATQWQLQLLGEADLTLEYGDVYREPGARVEGVHTRIKMDGQVDVHKLGTYILTYEAAWDGEIKTVKRTVSVVDTTAPIITLRTDPDAYTVPNQAYIEEGYSAMDACDGDITQQVQRRVEGGQVIYTVTDASGNRAEAVRSIVYRDPIAPQITLLGQQQLTITAGTVYEEAGMTAEDNCDGDLTQQVQIAGTVDYCIPGIYILTYRVMDAAGNMAECTREVTVVPQMTDEKVIYLTFDDGPGAHTERLLDILDKYQIKATFFVAKTSYIHLLPTIAERGHAIGAHTMSHRYDKIYTDVDAYFRDLYGIRDLIYEMTGIRTTLIRFPGGSGNKGSIPYCPGIMTQLVREVRLRGFQYFDWNVVANDAVDAKTADEVYENVIKGIGNKKQAIVLQHDPHGFSVDAVERIIIWGLENGYSFRELTPDSPGFHQYVNN